MTFLKIHDREPGIAARGRWDPFALGSKRVTLFKGSPRGPGEERWRTVVPSMLGGRARREPSPGARAVSERTSQMEWTENDKRWPAAVGRSGKVTMPGRRPLATRSAPKVRASQEGGFDTASKPGQGDRKLDGSMACLLSR